MKTIDSRLDQISQQLRKQKKSKDKPRNIKLNEKESREFLDLIIEYNLYDETQPSEFLDMVLRYKKMKEKEEKTVKENTG